MGEMDNHNENNLPPARVGTRILIIEDNPADAALVREMLTNRKSPAGYQLEIAKTLKSGMAALAEKGVDVVLLDLSLPDSFGFRTLSTVRAKNPDVPVIVMTGFGDENFASRALHEGAQGFISKNRLEEKTLRRLIQSAIVRKYREDELVITYRFLKITNRQTERQALARDFVREIRAVTGCHAARIRIFDPQGNLQVVAEEGFADTGNGCTVCAASGDELCRCLQVAMGTLGKNTAHVTAGGSFFVETGELFRENGLREQRMINHICANEPFESVALVPIRHLQETLGVIHLADFREFVLGVEMVELMEKVAMHLGAAIHRVQAEEELVEKEEMFLKLFENAPLAMLAVDEKMQIHSLNQAALNLAGCVAEAAIGQVVGRLFNCANKAAEGAACPDVSPVCGECPLKLLVDQTFSPEAADMPEHSQFNLLRSMPFEPLHLALRAARIHLGGMSLALLFMQDKTETVRVQSASRLLAERTVDSAACIVITDLSEGTILVSSKAADTLFGDRGGRCGRTLQELAEMQPPWTQVALDLANGQTAEAMLKCRVPMAAAVQARLEVAEVNQHRFAVINCYQNP
jgi:DNA-binding NarL/FixJ family response regulator